MPKVRTIYLGVFIGTTLAFIYYVGNDNRPSNLSAELHGLNSAFSTTKLGLEGETSNSKSDKLQNSIPTKLTVQARQGVMEVLQHMSLGDIISLKKKLLDVDKVEGRLQYNLAINSSMQIIRLKLLEEISGLSYNKILEAALQGQPLGSNPKPQSMQMVIVSTWRSGSTFLDELLASHPGVYNHYEPLLHYEMQRFYSKDAKADLVQQLVHELLKCKYENEEYINAAKKLPDMFQRNTRLWEVCRNRGGKGNKSICYEKQFLESSCSIFPWSLMKLVRLGMELMTPILDDPFLNVHAILLLRDPRGIYNSRMSSVQWCKSPMCSDPSIICQHMDNDIKSALELSDKFPGRVHILRYEDLALFPFNKTQELLNDLGLDFDPLMEKFLKIHTTKEVNKPWTTSRESAKRVHFWTTKLNLTTVENIQSSCSNVMERLGYVPITSMNITNIKDILKPFKIGFS